MSKIVIDAREYSSSTGRYVSKLIEYLEKIDQENNYLILIKEKDFELYKPTNPNFTKILCPYKEFTFAEQLNFAKQLYALKADLVHFPIVQQPILYLKRSLTTIQDLTTIRFNNPAKNPYVFYIKQRVYMLVIWVAAYKSKAIITPSDFVKKDLVGFTKINEQKITVTYDSADPITDTPQPISKLENKRFIMYIGRPTPHKNLWALIEAFNSLKALYPDLLLVLAGGLDQNYKAIKQKALDLGYLDIIFTDRVSEGELRWLYEHCQAYVFPSLSEGFGLPGLEAMAHGAPVVSSSATCLPEIYGDAAMYFDPHDQQSMASAISEVLSNQKLRESLINAGKKQLKQYSWGKTAEETLAIYQRILKNNN